MNIVQKVTWKCMRKNKKRTLVTMIGVTICVAMISAVCMLASSFQDVMIRNEKAINGDYDAAFQLNDAQTLKNMQQDKHFSKTMRMNLLGTAALHEGAFHIRNTYRTTLSVYAVDVKQMAMIGDRIWAGTLPKTKDEILISKSLMNDKGFPYHIGDTITLPLYEEGYDDELEQRTRTQLETRTFTITGSFEPSLANSSQDSFLAYTTYQPSHLQKQMLIVKLSSKRSVQKQMDSLMKNYHLADEDVTLNETLLFYNGSGDIGMTRTIVSVCMILFLIILIGGVSLIYNAFSISLSERSRQLGMLASVGATRRQKRDSVLFEAGIIAVITIPLGIVSSIAGLWITFALLNPYLANANGTINTLHVVIHGWQIVFTLGFTFLILLLSAWIPAKRAARISAIRAIRQNRDIRIPHDYVWKGQLTQRLFGIEGELGLKNMKRTRSRYLATLVSLIVCIVIFMASTYFSQRMEASYRMAKSDTPFDIMVTISTNANSEDEQKHMVLPQKEVMNPLLHASNAKKSSYYLEENIFYGEDMVFREEAKQFLRKSLNFTGDVGPYESQFPRITLTVLDDDSFAQYCTSNGVDAQRLNEGKEPSVILVNTQSTKYQYNDNGQERQYAKVTWLKAEKQDILHFRTMQDYMENNDINDAERASQYVKIAHIADQAPNLGYGNAPQIIMVTNLQNLNLLNAQMAQANRSQLTPLMHVQYQSDHPDRLQQELMTILENYGIYSNGIIQNAYARRIAGEQQKLLLHVMLFGFLTLIVLICMANIFNTITTSVNLRKREFAMIRSVGITRAKFYKMMAFEVLFYGVKACLYGIPIGFAAMLLLNRFFQNTFMMSFQVDWITILGMILVLFLILSLAMLYAIRKVRRDSIVETIRQESIKIGLSAIRVEVLFLSIQMKRNVQCAILLCWKRFLRMV